MPSFEETRTDAISPYYAMRKRADGTVMHYDHGSVVTPLVGDVSRGDSPHDWRQRKADGLDATSYLLGHRTTHQAQEGFLHAVGLTYPQLGETYTYRGKQTPEIPGGSSYPSHVPSFQAANSAAMRIMAEYRDAVAEFRGADFTAELLETISFLANPAKAIFGKAIGLANSVRKLKKFAKKKELYAKHLASSYLSFTFGVAPLADDIAAAAYAVTDLAERSGRIKSISAIGSSSELFEDKVVSNPYCGSFATQRRTTTIESVVKYRGKVGLDFSIPGDIAAAFGFSAPDIIPAVWEAVPFSFLIDYFTNVGDVLASVGQRSAPASPYLRYLVQGVKNSWVVKRSGLSWSNDGAIGYAGSCHGGSSETSKTTVERSSAAALPPIYFELGMPSVKQAFNIGALIAAVNASKP